MPTSFRVMVSNDDEGEDLGEYESDYLPRVGDDFALWHPRVCRDKDTPFLGRVDQVRHEARAGEPIINGHGLAAGSVSTTVWLVEENAPPTLYCDCPPEERDRYEVVDGLCDGCRGQRGAARK